MAARATLALKAGVWLRRGLLLIVSPVRGYHRRYQAETPLIDLFKFASPALYVVGLCGVNLFPMNEAQRSGFDARRIRIEGHNRPQIVRVGQQWPRYTPSSA